MTQLISGLKISVSHKPQCCVNSNFKFLIRQWRRFISYEPVKLIKRHNTEEDVKKCMVLLKSSEYNVLL